jgi:hypothetical protein
VSEASAPVSTIEWEFTHLREGYRCAFTDIPHWLQLAALREWDAATADPDFTTLTVEYCDAKIRSPFRLVLRRWFYDEDAGTWRSGR